MSTDHETAAGADPPDDEQQAQTALGTIVHWFDSALPSEPTDDARAAIDELIPADHTELKEYLIRFCALIALSASIAGFGLLADSGAVVIGAMLVAPLMTPIMAAAAATVTANNINLIKSILVILLGTTLAIAVGWLVSLMAGGSVIDVRELPQEIRSRTFPGLLDLGVAITAGAAAGYIQPRRSAISALPGVGIAVALVPPLATVGITIELGLYAEARNALLLYLTNLAAIIFAAGLVLLLTGFRPVVKAGRGVLRRRILVTLAAVLVVAVPLFDHTRDAIRDTRLRSSVVKSVEVWDNEARILELQADISNGTANVELVLVGLGAAPPSWQLADEIRDRFGGSVELRVLYQSDELSIVSSR